MVPAYNEEVTIEANIRSLLALDYKLYEIVVVDDGSSDDTSKVVRDAFHMQQISRPIQRKIPCQAEEVIYESYEWKVPITLIRKKNGGKADALNMGINAAKYPYFICMDADSVLQYDSLEKSSALCWRTAAWWQWAALFVPAMVRKSMMDMWCLTVCLTRLSLVCRCWNMTVLFWRQGYF